MEYEESLKYYRDLKNSLDTAKEEGREEERQEIARKMKQSGMAIENIAAITGLKPEIIEKL